jgi:toxin CcdB
MIRQFDVVANPDPSEAGYRPFLVNLQSDLVSQLTSTVVAPLVPRAQMRGAQHLNPIVTVNSAEFWLATHELFAIDRRVLKGGPVANLSNDRDAIIAALDFVFTGI